MWLTQGVQRSMWSVGPGPPFFFALFDHIWKIAFGRSHLEILVEILEGAGPAKAGRAMRSAKQRAHQ